MILSKSEFLNLRSISFVIAIVMFSFFTIGGCNNNSGSSNPELVVLGAHRDVALSGISSVIPITPHLGDPTNILLDGVMIDDLSDEDIALIRKAYEAGFVIAFYDVSERDIIQIYSEIIDHPFTHSEVESLEGILEGNMSPIFTIEQHGNVDWTSTGNFNRIEEIELTEGDPDQEEEFAIYGSMLRDWLKDHPSRKQQVIDENLNSTTASRLVDNAGLRSELDEQLGIDTRDETGSLLDLAAANINSYRSYIRDPNSGIANIYEMVSKAWIVTADTPTGIFSFLMVGQNFNLASNPLFIHNKIGQKAVTAGNIPEQGYYLKEYTVSSFYSTNTAVLDFNKALLLEESPATNQATSQTSTTSLMTSIQGTVAANTKGEGTVTIQGGVTWGTSTTVSKADVSINNLSLGRIDGNDATWQFLPRRPEPGGQKDACMNFGLRNLADLAHTTFQPATAFILQIDGDFVGQTLNIISTLTIDLEKSRIPLSNCNLFGCSCSVSRTPFFNSPFTLGSVHSLGIPYPPEGPAGDKTCSDGLDNDFDTFIDSDDPNCQ